MTWDCHPEDSGLFATMTTIKNMNNITKILQDLYELDPDLKNYEPQIMKIIEKFLNEKPDVRIDDDFAAELKSRIMSEAKNMKKEDANQTTFVWLPKIAYVLSGAALVVLLALPFVNFKSANVQKRLSLDSSKSKLAVLDRVNTVKPNAFGFLNQADLQAADGSTAGKGAGGEAPIAADQAAGLGGGGNYAISESEKMAVSSRMIAPSLANYEYVYTGEEFNLSGEAGKVYKKANNSFSSGSLVDDLKNISSSVLDLDKFSNMEVQTVNLLEDKEFGHSLFINNEIGSIDIGTNWQMWPRPQDECRDPDCFERYRLGINDVPADDKIINIAKNYLESLNIELDNYGEPSVRKYWEDQILRGEDKANIYIPDEVSVIFPLQIEEKPVYDESGNPSGLTVGVNIRYDKVTNVHAINNDTYDASEYDLVNDKDRIMKVLEQGGIHPNYRYEDADKTITVNLGNPEQTLLRYWRYDEKQGKSEEFYIPALYFPVESISDETAYFYKKAIVIPLVEDFLKQREDDVRIQPMPLLKEPAVEPMMEPMILEDEATEM